MRYARAAQPRPMPTSLEWATLEELDAMIERAWDELRAAPIEDKAVLREIYSDLKRDRDEERLKVVRKMHYRRKNYIAAN